MKTSNITGIKCYGEECVRLAAEDLIKDIRLATGRDISQGGNIGNIIIGTVKDAEIRESYCLEVSGWEQYEISITDENIVIAGSDSRGAMWGIYKISELLGVPAGIRFTQSEVKPCAELPNGIIKSKPLTYKFRGWFINDEDLLSCWHKSDVRELKDYPFYQDITDMNAVEMVVETALRMGFNLIIPATLLDIADARQEKIVEYCVKRGMFVSQHHIEPMGVSHWYYDTYMEKRNRSGEFSFAKNKADALEVWRYYASIWAKYKDNVIWQLGLRGKADRPVWEKDSSKDMAYWGNVISDAIQAQYDIVEELCGSDFYSTSTLWMEGATLYHAGYLRIPQKTTIVFSDVGPTQMLSKDFYDIPREANRTYGMYYHICYWGDGAHLAQGTSWQKMYYNYSLAVEKGDTEYSILNTSNVRDFILSDEANSALTRNFEAFKLDEFKKSVALRYFGTEEMGGILNEYFKCFMNVPVERLVDKYSRYFSFKHGEYEFNYYSASDGFLKYLGYEALDGVAKEYYPEMLTESIKKFADLYNKACKIKANDYLDYFLHQVRHIILFSSWCLECCLYSNTRDGMHLSLAITHLEEILKEREKYATGIFEGWYNGERKIGIKGLIEETQYTLETGKRLNKLM